MFNLPVALLSSPQSIKLSKLASAHNIVGGILARLQANNVNTHKVIFRLQPYKQCFTYTLYKLWAYLGILFLSFNDNLIFFFRYNYQPSRLSSWVCARNSLPSQIGTQICTFIWNIPWKMSIFLLLPSIFARCYVSAIIKYTIPTNSMLLYN